MRLRPRSASAKVEMQMTPMIDVVFQLLSFFIVSFKVIQSEGDLAIKMPASTTEGAIADVAFDVPLRVQLLADQQGGLAAIEVVHERLADTTALRHYIESIAAASPQDVDRLAVDLVCDPGLHYTHAMAALTAVSGKRAEGKILPLARNVRLVAAK